MFKKLQKYLNKSKVISSVGSFDERGLLIAIEEVRRDILDILIQANISVNCKDERGVPALTKAIKANDLPMIKQLIEAGADIDTKDREGKTPIMKAIEGGNKHVFSYLLKQYPDLELTDKMGDTALIKAALEGSTSICQKLIDADVDLDAANRKGITALMVAVDHLRTGIIKALLNAGADPNIKDNKGRSVLDRHHASPRITKMLKEAALRHKFQGADLTDYRSNSNNDSRESLIGQLQGFSTLMLTLTADMLNLVENNEKLKELELKGNYVLSQMNPDSLISMTAKDREKMIEWVQEQLSWGLNLMVHLKEINANLHSLKVEDPYMDYGETNINTLQKRLSLLLHSFAEFLAQKTEENSPGEEIPMLKSRDFQENEIPSPSNPENESADHE
jgi:ankyrin repeat protein